MFIYKKYEKIKLVEIYLIIIVTTVVDAEVVTPVRCELEPLFSAPPLVVFQFRHRAYNKTKALQKKDSFHRLQVKTVNVNFKDGAN